VDETASKVRGLKRPLHSSGFWRAYFQSRYAILFYSLLLMLVAMPTANTFGLPQVVIKLWFALCLLLAVIPSASKRSRRFFVAAVLLLILIRFISERDEVPIDFGPVLVVYALAGLVAAAGTLRFAVSSPVVDSETIYAALSTYLLAGLFFGVLYSAVEYMAPGSFSGPGKFSESAAVYYSFVTVATLGYGDYLPRTEISRGIAVLEVIGGQLFLAVMVARLIGAFDVPKRD